MFFFSADFIFFHSTKQHHTSYKYLFLKQKDFLFSYKIFLFFYFKFLTKLIVHRILIQKKYFRFYNKKKKYFFA